MADVKKVLVIDDHFEMLELLRSMLELSNEECEVLAVPSAEEGLLELRRTPFDLVITDVRLPGMSGFDLVRRMQRLKRETPVIMITAYTSSEGQKEANELGVLHYFSKPLDTDAVLMAVQMALHGKPPTLPVSVEEVLGETAVSEDVRKRLKTLQTDTGATGLMLSTLEGKLIFQISSDRPANLTDLSEVLAQNIKNSFALAGYLVTDKPSTIQYHAGDKVELYCANIGQRYFLTIFFDVQSRRGRIGTIWVFTQRAIKDLIEMLPEVYKPLSSSRAVPVVAPVGVPVGAAPVVAPPAAERELNMPPLPPQPEPEMETAVEENFLDLDASDLDDLFGETNLAQVGNSADAFWDDALTETDRPVVGGLSLEEAKKQGLFQTDLNADQLLD
jgi:DNA-binding response OmpR family regulator